MPEGKAVPILQRVILALLGASWRRLLLLAALLLPCITALDLLYRSEPSFGVFYLIPILLVSPVTSRAQMLWFIALCILFRLAGKPPVGALDWTVKTIGGMLSYSLVGFFAMELIESRRAMARQFDAIRREQDLRIEAEEQLRLLADSSPAAILTIAESGAILSANRATRDLLGFGASASLTGEFIGPYLPVLADALKLNPAAGALRTAVQAHGTRRDGSPFLVQVWFSTYQAAGQTRLAAIAVDSSEELREREEQNFEQIVESNRVIAGAIAHELRNVCGAISVVYSNLRRVPEFLRNPDFQALGSLVAGVESLAQMEMRRREPANPPSTDLRDVLNQLRVFITPAWDEIGASIDWPALSHPVQVQADSFALLLALLNLTQNSRRAVEHAALKRLTITAGNRGPMTLLRIHDSGPGVGDPERLFRPFHSPAGHVGLGLYVSRALLRRYGGDLCHEPTSAGACFRLDIPISGASFHAAEPHAHHTSAAD